MGEDVKLDYCQSDRDLLRDTNANAKATLELVTTHTEEDKERFERIDTRIGTLETWHARVSAVSSFAGFVAGLAVKYAGAKLAGLFG